MFDGRPTRELAKEIQEFSLNVNPFCFQLCIVKCKLAFCCVILPPLKYRSISIMNEFKSDRILKRRTLWCQWPHHRSYRVWGRLWMNFRLRRKFKRLFFSLLSHLMPFAKLVTAPECRLIRLMRETENFTTRCRLGQNAWKSAIEKALEQFIQKRSNRKRFFNHLSSVSLRRARYTNGSNIIAFTIRHSRPATIHITVTRISYTPKCLHTSEI